MDQDSERRLLIAIAAATVATGAAQAAAPAAVLKPLQASDDPTARHLFGTVGMFMVCVGGTLLGTLRRGSDHPAVVLWSGAQKLGAAGAVGLGVRRGIFSRLALAVAAFDAFSGLLALDYWRRTRR